MFDNSICFILTPDGYEEITYAELILRRETDATYSGRRFVPVHGMLLEVGEADYKAFYRDLERQKYLRKEARRVDEVSYNTLDVGGMNGEDIIVDQSPLPDDIVSDKMMLEALYIGLGKLPDSDRDLLTALFFDDMSETEFAKSLGITQQAVSKRRRKALERLKELMGF
jgi:RNA polymerase sigma factor (sigma-70 family)